MNPRWTSPTEVLGIEVGAALVRRWVGWLAPVCQPFFLTAGEVVELGLTPDHPEPDLPFPLRDTYQVWNLPQGLEVVWLDERVFHAQPREVRAELVRAQAGHGRGAVPTISGWADLLDARVLYEQADGHRFVWWPTLVEPCAEAVLMRFVSDDQLPCRRMSVPDDVLACRRFHSAPRQSAQRNLRGRKRQLLRHRHGGLGGPGH